MKIAKITTSVMLGLLAGVVISGLTACGSSATSDTVSGDTRVLSGTITDATATASLSKDAAYVASAQSSCIDTECSVRAMNSNGEQENGEMNRETHRWQVRLRAGEWRIGFYNAQGELAGYLDVGDSTTFRLGAGADLDLGLVALMNGFGTLLDDVEGLGELGFRSAYGRDMDLDGSMDELENEISSYDPAIFSIVKVQPFDGKFNVAPCRPVKIYLSQPIDETTLDNSAIAITDAEGAAIEGTFSYEMDDSDEDGEITEYIIKFTPSGSFALGAVINIIVPSSADGLLNADGASLDKEYAWSFTIRDFGDTSSECHDMDSEHRQYRERVRNQEQNNGANQENEEQMRLGAENGK